MKYGEAVLHIGRQEIDRLNRFGNVEEALMMRALIQDITPDMTERQANGQLEQSQRQFIQDAARDDEIIELVNVMSRTFAGALNQPIVEKIGLAGKGDDQEAIDYWGEVKTNVTNSLLRMLRSRASMLFSQ